METIHDFERAGLGKAPFRFVGSAERLFQACPGEPVKPGGCCKFCFAGIRYACIIKSADGQINDVGQDCVKRLDPEIYTAYRAELKEQRRAERESYWAVIRAEEAAGRADRNRAILERANAVEAASREELPDLWAKLDSTSSANGYMSHLRDKIIAEIRAEGDPDESELSTFEGLVLESECAGFHGCVGDKLKKMSVTYIGHVAFESSFGTQRVYKFRTADNKLLTWKTSGVLDNAQNKTGAFAAKSPGMKMLITATVKAHVSYRKNDGSIQAQTSILRVKAEW